MNTFEWGDYIDRAWDNWISEPSSLLFVCETQLSSFISKSDLVGVIHILQCSNNSLWIEGLRIHKLYRNNGFATALLNHSIDYGTENNLNECCALVSQGNFASQKMLEKLGFLKLFTCTYYITAAFSSRSIKVLSFFQISIISFIASCIICYYAIIIHRGSVYHPNWLKYLFF